MTWIRISGLLWEWRTIIKWKFIYKRKIIMKNPGIIQWDDGCFILRANWQDKFTLKQMQEFGKNLRKVNDEKI